jgi:hypothetical protein
MPRASESEMLAYRRSTRSGIVLASCNESYSCNTRHRRSAMACLVGYNSGRCNIVLPTYAVQH